MQMCFGLTDIWINFHHHYSYIQCALVSYLVNICRIYLFQVKKIHDSGIAYCHWYVILLDLEWSQVVLFCNAYDISVSSVRLLVKLAINSVAEFKCHLLFQKHHPDHVIHANVLFDLFPVMINIYYLSFLLRKKEP